MRVVVLHGDGSHPFPLERVAGREVVGVGVVRDHLRRDRDEPLEVRNTLAE